MLPPPLGTIPRRARLGGRLRSEELEDLRVKSIIDDFTNCAVHRHGYWSANSGELAGGCSEIRREPVDGCVEGSTKGWGARLGAVLDPHKREPCSIEEWDRRGHEENGEGHGKCGWLGDTTRELVERSEQHEKLHGGREVVGKGGRSTQPGELSKGAISNDHPRALNQLARVLQEAARLRIRLRIRFGIGRHPGRTMG